MSELKQRRIEAGLSQRELGEKAHVPQNAISEHETGKRPVLWPKARRSLARVLKVKQSELFPEPAELVGK